MTIISLSESNDPRAKAALERLLQLKSQLNLSSSPMSRQAPKDMARERAACEFNIEELAKLWAGGEKKYELLVSILLFIRRPNSISQTFFFVSKRPLNLSDPILN